MKKRFLRGLEIDIIRDVDGMAAGGLGGWR